MISISDKRIIFGSDIDTIDNNSRRRTLMFVAHASGTSVIEASPITAARILSVAGTSVDRFRTYAAQMCECYELSAMQHEPGRGSLPETGSTCSCR